MNLAADDSPLRPGRQGSRAKPSPVTSSGQPRWAKRDGGGEAEARQAAAPRSVQAASGGPPGLRERCRGCSVWDRFLRRQASLDGGQTGVSRRAALAALGRWSGLVPCVAGCVTGTGSGLRVGTFSADVTVPLGHGMMGGAWLSTGIADALEARGIVLLGPSGPAVFVSVDWCEIRNDAYARWQAVLAAAAGTRPERVMVSAVHQHDAPVADLMAEHLLRDRGLKGTVCDPVFHEEAVQRVALALRSGLANAKRVTHLGTGQARVERVASNRRYLLPDGAVRFDRTSSTRNEAAIQADEGLIDPWLRTLSFWDGEARLAELHFYAVHPMSYYGRGEVSADFPGLARRRRQAETPGVTQIYVSGCSGNLTAGKYNTGAQENRPVLAGRIYEAMVKASAAASRAPAREFDFRVVPLVLEPRASRGFTEADLATQLTPQSKPFSQCLAAMGLSWRRRVAAGRPIEVPCLDFGIAAVLLLPGESYVEYQLAAQCARPAAFVCTAGYGDGATGYIPTERHWAEGDGNLSDWCWVAPGAESRMLAAIRQALRV